MNDEFKVKKKNVLNAFEEIKKWGTVTPSLLSNVLNRLFPEAFEEEKKESVSELNNETYNSTR